MGYTCTFNSPEDSIFIDFRVRESGDGSIENPYKTYLDMLDSEKSLMNVKTLNRVRNLFMIEYFDFFSSYFSHRMEQLILEGVKTIYENYGLDFERVNDPKNQIFLKIARNDPTTEQSTLRDNYETIKDRFDSDEELRKVLDYFSKNTRLNIRDTGTEIVIEPVCPSIFFKLNFTNHRIAKHRFYTGDVDVITDLRELANEYQINIISLLYNADKNEIIKLKRLVD